MYRHKVMRLASFVFLWMSIFSVSFASGLQVASTVTLDAGSQVEEGTVVVTDEDSGTYEVSSNEAQANIFGVTAPEPSLVFVTGENQTPVVTEGVSHVRVSGSGGSIKRGDLLISSSIAGVAVRAGKEDENVFAIALEGYESQGVGLIQAEIGSDRAQALQAAQLVQSNTLLEEVDESPTIARMTVSAVLVIGALFFILYSFRSSIAQGVISVGRNPRARRSIVTLSFANIVFAVLLCAVVVFIAVAILILPL